MRAKALVHLIILRWLPTLFGQVGHGLLTGLHPVREIASIDIEDVVMPAVHIEQDDPDMAAASRATVGITASGARFQLIHEPVLADVGPVGEVGPDRVADVEFGNRHVNVQIRVNDRVINAAAGSEQIVQALSASHVEIVAVDDDATFAERCVEETAFRAVPSARIFGVRDVPEGRLRANDTRFRDEPTRRLIHDTGASHRGLEQHAGIARRGAQVDDPISVGITSVGRTIGVGRATSACRQQDDAQNEQGEQDFLHVTYSPS